MKMTTFNWSLSPHVSDVEVVRKKKELKLRYKGTKITVLERDVQTRGGIIDNWAAKINRARAKREYVLMVFTRRSNKTLVEAFKKRYPYMEEFIAVGTVEAVKKLNNIHTVGNQLQLSV